MAQNSFQDAQQSLGPNESSGEAAGSAKAGPRAKPTKPGNGLSAEAKLADLKRRLHGNRRPQLGRRGAGLGPGHLYAEGRGRGARPPGRDAEPAGAREVHRSRARQAARRSRCLRGAPALRVRRCQPHPHRAPRLREGDQGAVRFRVTLERDGLGLLRRLDARAAGQRFRHHAALSREGAGFQPQVRGLPGPLRAHRRPADRRPRRGHDGRQRARALHRAARGACADGARHRRAAGRRRFLPARRLSRAEAARLRPHPHQALRLRFRSRPPRQDASSLLHQVLGRRRPHHDAHPRERDRRSAVLDAARDRPCALRAGRRCPLRRHAAELRHLRRRAREPVAPVGKRGRPQPRLLAALLSRSCATPSRSSSGRCRSKPSIAPSTRSSVR